MFTNLQRISRFAPSVAVLLLATACLPPQAAPNTAPPTADPPAQQEPTPETSTPIDTPTPTGTPSAAPTPKDWSETFQMVNSGVARVAVTLCDGGGVVTARPQELETLLGLEAGADDYLTNPFRPPSGCSSAGL
jgi:hypothetical protein